MKKAYVSIAGLGIDKDGELPEWYLIFAAGQVELEGEGLSLVDAAAAKQTMKNISRRGIDIVVDYEHQSIGNDKAPAAGWVKEWKWVEDRGLMARIEWTTEAAGYLKSEEYRYFSPVFYTEQKNHRLVAVHSIALTNTPKTNHLKPLLAKLGDGQHEEEENMDFLKKMALALGLDETATEAEVVASAEGLVAQHAAKVDVIPEAVITALGIEETDVSAVVASINVLKQQTMTGVSQEEFEALQKKIAKRDAVEAVSSAMAEGKISAGQQPWAEEYAERDPKGFAVFAAKAPVVVPMTSLPKGQTKTDSEVSAKALAVGKMMGVTEDELKKYGQDS